MRHQQASLFVAVAVAATLLATATARPDPDQAAGGHHHHHHGDHEHHHGPEEAHPHHTPLQGYPIQREDHASVAAVAQPHHAHPHSLAPANNEFTFGEAYQPTVLDKFKRGVDITTKQVKSAVGSFGQALGSGFGSVVQTVSNVFNGNLFRSRQDAPKPCNLANKDPNNVVRVFFEVAANDEPIGTINMELFHEVAPRTVENFRALATGEKGYGYLNSLFHHVQPGYLIQGGELLNPDGTLGDRSIYGPTFEDENFCLKHGSPGMLTMAKPPEIADANGSQFWITLVKTPWLDGQHVVFGRIAADLDKPEGQRSFDVVKAIEALGSESGETSKVIKISKSGEYSTK